MPWGSGSSSGELVAADTEGTALVGLTGTATPDGTATGASGLRGRTGRAVPAAPGSPAGPPGRSRAELAFGPVFALARSVAGFAAPSLSSSGAACGDALLGLPAASAVLASGAG